MLESVKYNGSSFKYASEEIKSDRQIVLDAVKLSGIVLEVVS